MNFSFLRTGAKALLPLVMAALLSACATSTPMGAADRAAIKTIKIDPSVTLPEKMFYHGREQSLAAVGGALGAMLGSDSTAGPSAAIVAKMKEANISLPDILAAEFKRAVEGAGLTVVDPATASDAEVTLVVQFYGLGQTHGFSALYPTMKVAATMKKADGTVVWQKTDGVLPFNSDNKTSKEFDEYMREPELLRTAMTTASAIVSKMLADDLKQVR